jgi:hypothetical protein
MQTLSYLIVAVFVLSALVAFAKSAEQDQVGAPPKPSPQQAQLESFAGVWNAELEMMGATSKGIETCKSSLGGFWLLTDFEGEFMGAPFHGHGVTGFDAARGKIVNVWVDSSGSPMTIAEGGFDASGVKLVAESSGVDRTGHPARFKHVTTLTGRDSRTFEIFQLADGGKEELAMRIRYTRK